MPKILVICPSRGRPKMCQEMVESFNETSKMAMLRVCLDNDDPELDAYRPLIGGICPYTIDIRQTTTNIINNQIGSAASDITHFSVTNDDFVFRTPGWDLKLLSELAIHGGSGIVYGNDLCAGPNLPTMSVISRDIVKAVGWLQMPTLTHLYGDQVWKWIGNRAQCLYYRPDVIIEHKHVFGGKMQSDKTHEWTNSQAMYRNDQNAFNKWITEESDNDIAKVKKILTECQ